MMKLKSMGLAWIFLAAGAVSPAVMAGTLVLTQTEYYFGDGGEFTAVTSPDNFAQYYAPSTVVSVNHQTGFQTFCVEADVYFWPNVTYSYTEGNKDSQGRALTEGTAYLYSQFAKGELAGYDFKNNVSGGSRWQDAGLLQAAIWYLQGGQSGGSSFGYGGAGNPYYDLAASALGANLKANATPDQFGVRILQLWDSSHNTYQNQLVFDDPVPDQGATLALLALSLAGLAAIGRGIGARQLALQPCRQPCSSRPPARNA
jgi:hypothetical protein